MKRCRVLDTITMLLGYCISVLSVVMFLEDSITKMDRIFYMILWFGSACIGNYYYKKLKDGEYND